MTTITRSRGSGIGRWALLALLALGVLAAVIVTPLGRVKTTRHATERHGSEAVAIRQCIQKNGALERWEQLEDPSVEYWMCQLPDGRVCVQVVQAWPSRVEGTDWRERSSFCPRGGVYERVIDYLQQFARPL